MSSLDIEQLDEDKIFFLIDLIFRLGHFFCLFQMMLETRKIT